MMGFDLYQAITDRIISELEKGTVPWQRPWTCPTGAFSHVTGKCDKHRSLETLILQGLQASFFVCYVTQNVTFCRR